MPKLNYFQEKMLEQALYYALDRGWYIIPTSKNKIPLIDDWSNQASCDEKQIVKWWIKYPSANIGILTGPESGIWVVDLDVKEDVNGVKSLANYFKEEFKFDSKKYLVGKTPTGGVHLFFEWNDDYPVKTTSDILPGVDTRGKGGQIMVYPSSRNIEGEWKTYRMNNINLPVSPMLEWTFDLIKLAGRSEHNNHKKKLNLSSVLAGLTEGQRDEQLNRFAWLLRHAKISYALAESFVMTAAEKCNPPFDPEVARQKVYRAYTTNYYEDDDVPLEDRLDIAFGTADDE